MKNDLYIVTGGSHGFGRSIVLELLKRNHQVISFSRSALPNADIKIYGKQFSQVKIDLSKNFQSKVQNYLKKVNLKNINSVFLINNAGMIDPIDRVENLKETDLVKHMHVNLVAPIVMSQLCMKKFKSQLKIITQITSGAATSPVEGWAAYCAGKAGLDMFNRVLAEQMKDNLDFKAIGYSPGIMDTNMQKNIRSATAGQFPNIEEFKKYKSQNQLRSTDLVAQDLLKVMADFKNLKSGHVYRVSF